MECRELHALLSGYIDAELSRAQFQEADRHIASCDPCRRLADDHRRIKRWVGSMERKEASPSALERIRASLDDAGRRDRRRVILFSAFSSVAAAAVVIVAFALLFFTGDRLPSALADSIVRHQGYVDGKYQLSITSPAPQDLRAYFRENGGIDVDVPAMAPARLVGGCPCGDEGKPLAPWIVYEVNGTPLSLILIDDPSSEIAACGCREEGAGHAALHKDGWNIIICRGGRYVHVWISSLPEEEMLRVIRSTEVAKQPPEGVAISIGGMTCSACCSRVESVACSVPGVKCVTTDLRKKEAVITLENASVDVGKVLHALRKAGYTVDIKR